VRAGLDLDVTDGLESLLNKNLLRREAGLPGERLCDAGNYPSMRGG
jgi:hypothetical protein